MIINKKIKIIWQDGNRTSAKYGIVKEIDEDFITIENNKRIELINKNKILRIEVLK